MDKKRADQDHFIELDAKKLKHIEAERKRLLTEDMQGVADIHFMRCPRCSRHLGEKNIKDICFVMCEQCKGIWINSESLEKIGRLSDDMVDVFFDHIKK